nr:hypothetical protein [Tanacetum cinerariifolium]
MNSEISNETCINSNEIWARGAGFVWERVVEVMGSVLSDGEWLGEWVKAGSVPAARTRSVPAARTRSVPAARTRSVPAARTRSVLAAQTRLVPTARTRSVLVVFARLVPRDFTRSVIGLDRSTLKNSRSVEHKI